MNIYRAQEDTMAAKTKSAKKKPASKKDAKPKAEKPEAVVAVASVAEAPAAVEPKQVAEVAAPVAPMPAKSIAQKPKTQRTLKKGLTGLPALREVVKFMVGAYNALRSIECRFDQRETAGVKNVQRYGVKQAKIRLAGGHPNLKQVTRTVALATKVATEFDARFEAIMRDSFVRFDSEIKKVEQVIPDIRARDGDKITELQNALRAVLAKPDADYDETIDAFNAMMGYLPSISAQAKDIVDAERKRKRDAAAIKVSEDLIAELESLEIDD